VGRRVAASPQTIANWAEVFDWKGRIQEYASAVKCKEDAGELMIIDDPVVRKLVVAMERVEALIESAFTTNPAGKMVSTIVINDAEELTRLLAEYRRMLEVYNKVVSEFKPDSPNAQKKGSTTIKNLTVQFGNLPQKERIELMRGITHGDDTRGDQQSAGGIQDADFTEVPERGDAD